MKGGVNRKMGGPSRVVKQCISKHKDSVLLHVHPCSVAGLFIWSFPIEIPHRSCPPLQLRYFHCHSHHLRYWYNCHLICDPLQRDLAERACSVPPLLSIEWSEAHPHRCQKTPPADSEMQNLQSVADQPSPTQARQDKEMKSMPHAPCISTIVCHGRMLESACGSRSFSPHKK